MNKYCINQMIRTKKGIKYFYCKKKRTIIDRNECFSCISREIKNNAKSSAKIKNKYTIKLNKKPINKVSKNNTITKSTSIPTAVKKIVWERDQHKCIFCDKEVSWNYANSHYIKRSHLGMGIEENIMTNCSDCHNKFDNTIHRKEMLPIAREYFKSKYPNWNEDILIYKKG